MIYFYFIVYFKTENVILRKKKNVESDIFGHKSYYECPSMHYDFSEEIEVIFRTCIQAIDLGHTTSGWWSPAVVPFSANPVMKYDI